MLPAVGQFVVTGENRLGIGKVADVNGDQIQIDYFDSPANEVGESVSVDAAKVKVVKLSNESRVFCRDPNSFRWQVGRVLAFHDDNREYLVRFPNEQRELLPESVLYTRWSRPISSPTELLAYQLNETPFWHEGRFSCVRNIYQQRKLSLGMPSLLSSSIDLVEHQFNVARKILNDPFQRYLLADEVGLGKTIETGILIRQYVLDEPDQHQVLVIVPNALVQQWKLELKLRFDLGDLLDVSVHVVSLNDHESIASWGRSAGMIVIDEAHHFSAWATSNDPMLVQQYHAVAEFTADTRRKVLLLSATPVLNNERSFLAMLHLIDPVLYPLNGYEAFKTRVDNRQEVAEVLASLQEDESNYFLNQSLDSLDEFFQNDARFARLRDELMVLIDDDVEEDHPRRCELIRAMRLHVSEAWRLHRRLIRNRRGEATSVLLPGRSGCETCEWQCQEQEKLESLYEEWRIGLAEFIYDKPNLRPNAVEIAKELLEAVVTAPEKIATIVNRRFEEPESSAAIGSLPPFESERGMLDRLVKQAKKLDSAAKQKVLLDLIRQLKTVSGEDVTVVVFANHSSSADDVYDFLKPFLPTQAVRHQGDNMAWTQVLGAKNGYVLICDRAAEEGLNLQKRSACIINYDLPFSPNRIEQRVGRLDRFGTGKSIKCHNLIAADSPLQNSWNEFLDKGLGVFNESIASLQYLVEDQLNSIWQEFIDAGHEAFDEAVERMSGDDGIVKRERRKVQLQDDLDCGDSRNASTTEAFEALVKFDLGSKALGDAIDDWMVQRLHFRRSGEMSYSDSVLRYEMCVKNDLRHRRGERTSLMPYHEWEFFFRRSLDNEVRPEPPVISQTHLMTFNRQDAQAREVPLARLGHPFINAIDRHIRLDDRGVCFAMWRYRPDLPVENDTSIFFKFFMIVEADESSFLGLKERWPETSLAALRRRADALFPPIFFPLILDSDLQRVTDAGLQKTLMASYHSKELGTPGPQDFNLNQDRWEKIRHYCDSDVWRELCFAAKSKAIDGLNELTKLPEKVKQGLAVADAAFAARKEQFESRIARNSEEQQSLVQEMEFEQAFHDVLVRSIATPSVRVDSVGGIFLSNLNPFSDERPREDDE